MGNWRERVLMNQETRLLTLLACALGAWVTRELLGFLEILEDERALSRQVHDDVPPADDVTRMMDEVRKLNDPGE
jgi:hypothetical protein